jgi:trans-2-enoyl-CoA reductase
LQGTYPIKPPLPAVGGGEGVGEVIEARECRAIKQGDWILPSVPMSGTWRSHAVYDEYSVIPVR